MKRRFSRIILMIAGIVTVVIILLSQSLYQPSTDKDSTAQTEQGKHHKPAEHVSTAPDVVPGPAVQMEKASLSLLEILAPEEPATDAVFPDCSVFLSFAKTLLKATISPNAP